MVFDQVAFGKRIKELRKEKSLSQEKAAEGLHISCRHYSSIEQGKKGCSIELLMELADFFCVSTDYLLLRERADQEGKRLMITGVIDLLEQLKGEL